MSDLGERGPIGYALELEDCRLLRPNRLRGIFGKKTF